MSSFDKASFSVHPPGGIYCRGMYYPGTTNVIGIHVHGFRSSIDHSKAYFFRDHALKQGYTWVNFDLPCHGTSEGEFRRFQITDALAAVIDVIHKFRKNPIVLFGVSLGGWLSMLAARQLANSADIKIAGAVLVAPAFDFFAEFYEKSETEEALREWRLKGVRQFFDEDDNQPYELDYAVVEDGLKHNCLKDPICYDFPIQILHGDEDEIVPISLSHRFKALSGNSDVTLHVIKGGDHSLQTHAAQIASEIDRTFQKACAIDTHE